MKCVPQVDRSQTDALVAACPDDPIILMIDQCRHLLDGTPSGSAMLARRDVLACEFGRVAACGQHDGVRLDRAIVEATATGGATLTLAEDALRIQIVRLGDRIGDARLLLICRLRTADTRHVETAAHLFGLTLAEHRLLKLLFAGMSLGSAALSLGVARTTARTHLQRIFDKTGSRRQSDLVRLVALGASRRDVAARPDGRVAYADVQSTLIIDA